MQIPMCSKILDLSMPACELYVQFLCALSYCNETHKI
jgi:hypothetical protein